MGRKTEVHRWVRSAYRSTPLYREVVRKRALLSFAVVLLSVLFTACTPTFPPQKVMEQRNYREFIAENDEKLQECKQKADCDLALFNLGFAYAYIENPHRNVEKAFKYFNELIRDYPNSPWAYQARAWVTLLNEQRALAKNRAGLEERQRKLQATLRDRDATIRTLRARLNRSRNIDIEMEKKERELLR